MNNRNYNILAISGSLRIESSNTLLIKSLVALAPRPFKLKLYDEIDNLPFFNPDLSDANFPAVMSFKNEIKSSDGILIASPEYAHGISGVLKNALDWLVGSDEFINKPIAIINTSSRATHAYASLIEIVKTMAGKIIPNASLTIPLTPGKKLNQAEIIAHPELSKLIINVIDEFIAALSQIRGQVPS